VSTDRDGNTSDTMSPRTAKTMTWGIVGFCLLALLLIFQPFAIELFSVGCVMVVVGGLIFNVIPFATPQHSIAQIGRVAVIVAIVLMVAVAIAIGCVELLL